MHAVLRWYPDPSLADSLVDHADAVRGVISGIAGVRSYHVVRTDQGTVTVTVCDDESTAAESTRAAAAWVAENLSDRGFAAPNVASGEVVLSL